MNLNSFNNIAFFLQDKPNDTFIIQREDNDTLLENYDNCKEFEYFGKKVAIESRVRYMCAPNVGVIIYYLKELKNENFNN